MCHGRIVKKKNPSGVSPNVAIAIPEEYGGEKCLQHVDIDVVKKMKQELGGEDLIRFVDEEYAAEPAWRLPR